MDLCCIFLMYNLGRKVLDLQKYDRQNANIYFQILK